MKLKFFERCVVCGTRTKGLRRVCDDPECDRRVYHGRPGESLSFMDANGNERYKNCVGTPIYDKQ